MATVGLKLLSLVGNVLGSVLDATRAITGSTKKNADHQWQKPSPTDRRSPCPMVNALANHGYLPRDGKNVSLAGLITGAKDGINLAPDAALIVGLKALQTSSTGSFLTFHLDDLNKHGVIEHDGSLSRNDIATGDNHTFSPELFHRFISRFPADGTISIEAAAEARAARLADAKATNPAFDLGADGARFSALESSLYLILFGQGTDGHARTEWVRTLFEEERLPLEEGWKRPENPYTTLQILAVQKKIEAVDTTA